ncbi:MAG TPA: hypothetical protein VG269_12480 [Tepidisphaeraceae bacterium]|nr:hypothetical protein [Tepidisphaeraceae bacterium]
MTDVNDRCPVLRNCNPHFQPAAAVSSPVLTDFDRFKGTFHNRFDKSNVKAAGSRKLRRKQELMGARGSAKAVKEQRYKECNSDLGVNSGLGVLCSLVALARHPPFGSADDRPPYAGAKRRKATPIYDLRATPHRCPECGTLPPPRGEMRRK